MHEFFSYKRLAGIRAKETVDAVAGPPSLMVHTIPKKRRKGKSKRNKIKIIILIFHISFSLFPFSFLLAES